MKKLFKKINKINKKIQDKKIELIQTQDVLNVYFLEIGTEPERQRDIKEIKLELKDLIDLKNALLDSLNQAINLEKADLSYNQKMLNYGN